MATQIQIEQPLPANSYNATTHRTWHDAYDVCLALQHGDKLQISRARVLGYLIREAPLVKGRNYICDEILRCDGDFKKLQDLAHMYVSLLLRFFRMSKGTTPAPSDHASCPTSKEERFFFSSALTGAPVDHRSAKLAALARDNYCCMVTGSHDLSHYSSLDRAAQIAIDQGPSSNLVHTHACHIFPPSTNHDLEPEIEGHHKISVSDDLDGVNIHRLSNILTLNGSIHSLFDELSLWFEEVPNTPNTYHINSKYPGIRRNFPPTVTFTSHNGSPPPNPKYLKLHAAACRVAHMSGAAEYIDKVQRDMEEVKVLARDGSSAETLSFALQTVKIC